MTLTKSNGSDMQILVAGAGKTWTCHWKSSSDSHPAPGIQGAQLLWIKSRALGTSFQDLISLSAVRVEYFCSCRNPCFQLVIYPQFQAPMEGNGCRGTQGWAGTELLGSSARKSCCFELKIDFFGTESPLLDGRDVCVCTGGRGNR